MTYSRLRDQTNIGTVLDNSITKTVEMFQPLNLTVSQCWQFYTEFEIDQIKYSNKFD